MDPDDAADILGDLPYEKAEKLLWLMGVQDSRRIRALLGYREKTAGGIMTPEFVTMPEDATVLQTVEKIRQLSEELETVHYVYTVNAQDQLTGALSLRSLVLAAPGEQVSSLASHEIISVNPEDDQEQVAETISKYDLLAVPVLDENHKILGIVTIDDALDVMEEEHDEDLQIAGATGMRDDSAGSLLTLLRWLLRRGMWFIIWAVVALLTVMAGGFSLFAGALALAPVVLLLADNAVALSINDLLDYDGKHGSQALPGLLGRNFAVALVFAAIGIALALGLNSALDNELGGSLDGAIQLLSAAGLPAVIVAVAIMLASVLVTIYGRSRLDKDKDLSNTALTLWVMLLSLAAQFGLTWLFAAANLPAVVI
jgi:Mg2+ transporter MgtE